MQLFPATAPLELVEIDILGQVLTIKRENLFLLKIADRFSTLVKTVFFTNILAGTMAKTVVNNWVVVYG